MEIDSFVAQLAELEQACHELAQRLEGLRQAVADIHRSREAGRLVSEIVASGRGLPARREVRASWSRVNRALHAYRVQVVRGMVDEEGMSIADVARVTGNARQVTSRLYHSA